MRMFIPSVSEDRTLDIAEGRDKLGFVVSRAVHSGKPTVITRSAEERAVLISESDFEDFVRLLNDEQTRYIKDQIAAQQRDGIEMRRYATAEELYAGFGMNPDGTPLPPDAPRPASLVVSLMVILDPAESADIDQWLGGVRQDLDGIEIDKAEAVRALLRVARSRTDVRQALIEELKRVS
ncbi:type II toxin-antitoxin system Phd/YefM family antitoxin [Planomonospora sp. ID91781]|uniref:type II toxin-antitoxin system prevent-host-death family antitoxin n=1 Tax=Planomonospora sp. ID91781 TaxID=2738135 RepID=UPI0018C3C651|nr:type II toxin-antitoxin system prevent-host-death family antitoxin [Planomonospora sp. ID91781]MBG0824329.1 type II toxin-antitoxin system Phd/YefM family antitoxin [Planomonospora sp. ID91781]